jgi:hypothetical protein
MDSEEIFFKELLAQTEEAYNHSNIRSRLWGFSVTATRIIKNEPLIVGFNWGVNAKWLKEGNKYNATKERKYPDNICFKDSDLGSLKRILPYFEKYYPDALSGMQTNFCFFRSQKENQISENDLDLSSGLFDQYLDYSTPSIIISFSKRLTKYLEKKGKLNSIEKKDIESGKKIIQAVTAEFQQSNNSIDFVNLPHPNYPITSEARNKAWEFCFPQK